MQTLLQDLRFGLRMLRRNPGFMAVTVLTMALGIGATAAIFSVVNGVLLRPLPFPDIDRLVMVWEGARERPDDLGPIGLLRFLDWKDQSMTLESMAFFEPGGWNQTLTDAEEAAQVVGARTGPTFFPVVGAAPLLGRTFTAEEAKEGGPSVVILSHGTWRRLLGADPAIIGKTIRLDRKPHTVVGIMPADFRFIGAADFWLPFPMDTDSIKPVGPGTGRGAHGACMIGKLKPGMTREQARAELETIASRRTQYPLFERDRAVRVTSLHEHLVKGSRMLLYVFQGAALLVLLVAAANVANLLLARSASRAKEMAVRLSLGAGRARLLRQLLTESLLLAAAGGGFGLLVAQWGVTGLRTLAAGFVPRMGDVSMDGHVLAVACLVTLASGIICGLAPALRATRTDLNECLKEGGVARGLAGSRRSVTRHGLVIGEIGLSLVLLIGAGLLLKSFVLLSRVELGFNPRNVLVVKMVGAGEALLEPTGGELLERLSSLPGVQAVGAINDLPPDHTGTWFDMSIEGGSTNAVYRQAMTPDYFRVMGIPLVKGRGITEQDTEGSLPVVVVNESFVKRCCGGVDPIGKVLVIHWDNPSIPRRRSTVIGVVKDVRNQTLLNEIQPEAYYSYRQESFSADSLILRTASDPMRLAASVREVIRSVEKNRPILSIQTMADRLAGSITPQRFQTTLVTLFSAVGLILAAVGVYGVVSYSVAQRVREFGIRIAVGAQRGDILQLVVRQALCLVAVGLGIGLCGALALTRVLKSFLFQVGTIDLATYVAVSVFLAGVALFASYVPARRAAKVDPMVALRCE
jgi:putative ABC transport system permease protein